VPFTSRLVTEPTAVVQVVTGPHTCDIADVIHRKLIVMKRTRNRKFITINE
jgi:hypothetical protein